MISMKKIMSHVSIFLMVTIHFISSMEESQRIKKENRKIRAIIRKSNKAAAILAVVSKTAPGSQYVSKVKCGNDTLTSFDSKNGLITIYDPEDEGKAYHRSLKDYLQIMKAKTSDDDEPNDTFEHTNREDGSNHDKDQLLETNTKSKKCCCLLY